RIEENPVGRSRLAPPKRWLPRVPPRHFPRKGGETTTKALIIQLLIAKPGAAIRPSGADSALAREFEYPLHNRRRGEPRRVEHDRPRGRDQRRDAAGRVPVVPRRDLLRERREVDL